MRRAGKVSFILLVFLISLCAVVFFAYQSGVLKQWMDKSPPPAKPAPVFVEPQSAAPAALEQGRSRPNNIFDVPGAVTTNTPSPIAPRPTGGGGGSPAVFAPAVNQPPKMTVREARVKLNSAMASVEKSLVGNIEYQRAKSDVDAADAARKAASTANEPGSPQVLEASQRWLDAKSKLQKIVTAAAAHDPAVTAAQNQLAEAEADNRPSKH